MGKGLAPARGLPRCHFHYSTPAHAKCYRCGRFLCVSCAVISHGGYACRECGSRQASRGKTGQAPLFLLGAALALILLAIAPLVSPLTLTSPAKPAVATPTITYRAPAVTARPTAIAAPPNGLEDAAAIIKRSAVAVSLDRGYGSGIWLGAGRVLTAAHVVEGERSATILVPGRGARTSASVDRVDKRRDLALLRSSIQGLQAATLAESTNLRAAETLLAVGYPRLDAIGGQEATVTRGIFSTRWKSPSGVWHVQTDASINPGNSGGALGDAKGNVVGVVTFKIRETVGLSYAVAGEEVMAFLENR